MKEVVIISESVILLLTSTTLIDISRHVGCITKKEAQVIATLLSACIAVRTICKYYLRK